MVKQDLIWRLVTRWIDGEATKNELKDLECLLVQRPDIAQAARLLYRLSHASVHDCRSEADDAAHLNIGLNEGNCTSDEGSAEMSALSEHPHGLEETPPEKSEKTKRPETQIHPEAAFARHLLRLDSRKRQAP